jgi:hypothetical protein
MKILYRVLNIHSHGDKIAVSGFFDKRAGGQKSDMLEVFVTPRLLQAGPVSLAFL